MKKSVLSVAVAAAMTVSATASAGQAEDMERALRSLEAQVSAMKAEIAKMKAEQAEIKTSSAGAAEWTNNVSIGGAVEFVIPEGGEGTLDTLELEISVQATESTSAYVKLKEDSGVQVDEASVTHDFGVVAVSATTGGHPFGDFTTNMVGDPLTKKIGDTDAAGARLIAEAPIGDNVTLSASADDDASSIAATAELGDLSVTVGHITDVEVDTTASANHAALSYAIGDLGLYAEMVDSDGSADATNVEISYGFAVAGRDAVVAIGRQECKNVSCTDASAGETWNMLGATLNVDEGLDVIVEHRDSDVNTNDAWQAKIAYGF